jgi:redox-sensitive bicupin YhaK (pirin superfamily)
VNEGDRACRLLQIWIEPSEAGIVPAYEQKHFQIGAGWTPLLNPEQAGGAMAIHRRVRLWRAQLEAGASLPIALPAGSQGWIQLIDGSGSIQRAAGPDAPLVRGDGLGFAPDALKGFTAGTTAADLLLFELH